MALRQLNDPYVRAQRLGYRSGAFKLLQLDDAFTCWHPSPVLLLRRVLAMPRGSLAEIARKTSRRTDRSRQIDA